jgi:glycosyltransferase involved in cell wall biosynthesis
MKILFDHPAPFLLAHGGVQSQIEQTRRGLEQLGIEVEYIRWWDDSQTGALIHYFGTASVPYLALAHQKKLPVVMTNVFSATSNRSDFRLVLQGLAVQTLLRLPGWATVKKQLTWNSYERADCNIVGLQAERNVLRLVYGIPDDKIRVVPLGVSDAFLNVQPSVDKEDHLITTGTITGVKRSLDLARMAHAARVPILFLGKPYYTQDPYWHEFQSLIDDHFVRYRPHVNEVPAMISLLRSARGFVIYSHYENWCLSAHEAAACGLPLLLPRQKWSLERFGNEVRYFDPKHSGKNVPVLRQFYEDCGSLHAPRIHLHRWGEAASQLKQVYETVLSRAR